MLTLRLNCDAPICAIIYYYYTLNYANHLFVCDYIINIHFLLIYAAPRICYSSLGKTKIYCA